VLTYHRVLPDSYRTTGSRPKNSLFSGEFERQIAYMARRYHVATGEELRAHLSGERLVPPYSVLLTFDDGYANNYAQAFPILRRYGVNATFFLTSGLIGQPGARLWFDRLDAVLSVVSRPDLHEWLRRHGAPSTVRDDVQLRQYIKGLSHVQRERLLTRLEQERGTQAITAHDDLASGLMSWDQAREMAAAGMTIGSHGVTHQVLAGASPEEVHAELSISRQRIERELGGACWCFSYPNGEASDFRSSDRTQVQTAGYGCAFTQVPGLVTPRSDVYTLPRISVPDSGDMRVFLSRLTGVHLWLKALGASGRQPPAPTGRRWPRGSEQTSTGAG
jgi:peptidoglycan/xylan/chitin deacetylase (PgdA/CDA1 family)